MGVRPPKKLATMVLYLAVESKDYAANFGFRAKKPDIFPQTRHTSVEKKTSREPTYLSVTAV